MYTKPVMLQTKIMAINHIIFSVVLILVDFEISIAANTMKRRDAIIPTDINGRRICHSTGYANITMIAIIKPIPKEAINKMSLTDFMMIRGMCNNKFIRYLIYHFILRYYIFLMIFLPWLLKCSDLASRIYLRSVGCAEFTLNSSLNIFCKIIQESYHWRTINYIMICQDRHV